MNNVILKGIIRDIQPSHKIKDIEYNKANIITKRDNGKEDILDLRFKKFSCNNQDGDFVELMANARSYSTTTDGKNKVELYFFTYFDKPEEEIETNNYFEIDGRICKLNPLYTNDQGKHSIHFILANNVIVGDNKQKINSYLPCIAFGKVAREISKLSVGDKVVCKGECHSRYYRKEISKDDYETLVAHELFVKEIESDAREV